MIGDGVDVAGRLKRLLPRWFGQDRGETPVLDAVLKGPSVAFAWVHELYSYAALQTRIATASGRWLDLIALDFFARDLKRKAGQSDASFRAEIRAQVLRPKATRSAMIAALTALTGHAPRIFEPMRAADTGSYDMGGAGYDVGGGYGEHMPAQVFVEVLRPQPAGTPNVSGFDEPAGGFDAPSALEWSVDADPAGVIDAEIYALINRVRPVGVTVWTRIVASFEDFSIVGGGTDFSDAALYGDGAMNYQPTTAV